MTNNSKSRHDLNNQLCIVLGFSDLLLDTSPEGDPRRPDLEEIQKAATTALHLLAQMFGQEHEDGPAVPASGAPAHAASAFAPTRLPYSQRA